MNSVFVHPSSIVETEQVGAGTRIWAFTHIMRDVSIGENCNIGDHCFIESGSAIGDNVTIKNGNEIWEGVTLSNGVFVGPRVFFTNDLYPRSPRLPQVKKKYSGHEWLRPTLVKQGASLGAGAIILAGITVGEFSMLAAGAVATKTVPAYALMIGSPARVRGWVCQCSRPLTFVEGITICDSCGLKFIKTLDTVLPVNGSETME
jgi:UDP-2-acetamido-3-amino-2,3-dideoxy-glucuronate N-acetyltransferase